MTYNEQRYLAVITAAANHLHAMNRFTRDMHLVNSTLDALEKAMVDNGFMVNGREADHFRDATKMVQPVAK